MTEYTCTKREEGGDFLLMDVVFVDLDSTYSSSSREEDSPSVLFRASSSPIDMNSQATKGNEMSREKDLDLVNVFGNLNTYPLYLHPLPR